MPVSLLSEDTSKGLPVITGLHRIVAIDWTVHQFPPNKTTGVQSSAFVCLAIGYQPIDEAGKPSGDVVFDYSLRVGPKFAEPLEKCAFAPASSPNAPLPLRVGVKGPFLEAIASIEKINTRQKPALWMAALETIGGDPFKAKMKEVHHSVHSLIGTEGDVYELVSENDGVGDDGKKMSDTKIPAFKSIRRFGWEMGAQAYAPAPAAAVEPLDLTALGVKIVKKLHEKNKGKTIEVSGIKQGLMGVTANFNPRVQSSDRAAVCTLLATPEFWEHKDLVGIAESDGVKIEFAA